MTLASSLQVTTDDGSQSGLGSTLWSLTGSALGGDLIVLSFPSGKTPPGPYLALEGQGQSSGRCFAEKSSPSGSMQTRLPRGELGECGVSPHEGVIIRDTWLRHRALGEGSDSPPRGCRPGPPGWPLPHPWDLISGPGRSSSTGGAPTSRARPSISGVASLQRRRGRQVPGFHSSNMAASLGGSPAHQLPLPCLSTPRWPPIGHLGAEACALPFRLSCVLPVPTLARRTQC